MALSFEQFVLKLKGMLTTDERTKAVTYAAATPIAAGTQLKFPRISIDVPWDAYLAFIDRQPMANWGHSARYVLVNRENGEAQSYEARLPPFGQGADLHWRVIIQPTP
jgi:hypothetical protein